MYGTGRRGGGRVIFGSGSWSDGRRNFNSSNNQNKRHELKFYPHGTVLDRQIATFTKVKEQSILRIQSEFVNGSDIVS